MSSSLHTWVMQKVNGAYADLTMKMVLMPNDAPNPIFDKSGLEDTESTAATLLAGECTIIHAGESMTPAGGGSCFELHVDTAADDSLFTIITAGITSLAVWTIHVPTEFERTMHYLQNADGVDVEPVAEVGAGDGRDHGPDEAEDGHDHGGIAHEHGADADETCEFAVQWLVNGYNSGAASGGYLPTSAARACREWRLSDVASADGFPFQWPHPPSGLVGDVCRLTCCKASHEEDSSGEGATCSTHVEHDWAKAVAECDIPSCNRHEHYECSGDVDRPDSWHCIAGNADPTCATVEDGGRLDGGRTWCWNGNRDFRCDDASSLPVTPSPSPSPMPTHGCDICPEPSILAGESTAGYYCSNSAGDYLGDSNPLDEHALNTQDDCLGASAEHTCARRLSHPGPTATDAMLVAVYGSFRLRAW